MSCCQHDLVWRVQFDNCFACEVNCLQNSAEPLCKRQVILLDLLGQLKECKERLFAEFGHDFAIADEVVSTIVSIYVDLGDASIRGHVMEGVLMFVSRFGERFVRKIASVFLQITIDMPVVATYHHAFMLMNDMLNHVPSLIENLAVSDNVISKISSCMCVPYEETRIVLLQLAARFVGHFEFSSGTLQMCSSLSKPVLTLLSTSDSANVLLHVIQVINESAKADDFMRWLITDEEPCDPQYNVFSHIKRCFMMHIVALTTSSVKLISLLISKQNLQESLLDSDLMGFVFDALKGLASICKSLSQVLTSSIWPVACCGFDVIQNILQNSPGDIPLLHTTSAFDQLYQVIMDAFSSKCGMIVNKSLETAPFLIVTSHLPHPPPYRDFTTLIEKLEEVLPQLVQEESGIGSQMEQFSQNIFQDIFTFRQSVLLNLFKCFNQCLSVLSVGANQQDLDDFEMTFIERMHSSLTNKWIPMIVNDDSVLCSPEISSEFFDVLVKSLQILKGEELFESLVTNKFLQISLSFSTKVSCGSIQQFLCTFCVHFLHNLGINDAMLHHMQQGFPHFKGQPVDILYMLQEHPLAEATSTDVTVSVVIAVVTSLAMACWFDQCFVPLCNLKESLISLLSNDRNLSSLPMTSRSLVLFLVCFVQQEELEPELPRELVDSLVDANALYLPHPAVVSCLLQTNDEMLARNKKLTVVKQWLGEMGDVTADFHSHPVARHLMGLMLLNHKVALLVLDVLTDCDNAEHSRKVVLLLSGALRESACSETAESSPPEFVTSLCHHFPYFAMEHLTIDNLKQAPNHVASSLFEVLEVVMETNSLDDVTVHKMLRQGISLVCDARRDDAISDVIAASLVYLVEQLLKALSRPSDVVIVLSHTRFLPSLQDAIDEHIAAPANEQNYVLGFEIQLLALLVSMVSDTNTKVNCKLRIKAEDMLKFCMGPQATECSMLKLWSALYRCGFASELLAVEGTRPEDPRTELTSDIDAMLCPLTHGQTTMLYVAALNATVKGYPGIRLSALRCVRDMLGHVRRVTTDEPVFFQDLATSLWLRVAVQFNSDEKDPVVLAVCKEIKSLCTDTE